MSKVIIIGVGSTGLSILEQTQQYYYEFTKQGLPNHVEMMFVETDKGRMPAILPDGNTYIKSCYLDPININATLESWNSMNQADGNGNKPHPDWNWLPTAAGSLNGDGAGGQSTYGRLLLWANANTVENMVNGLYQGGDGNTQFYIVGSFTGGTGSGIFIDMAYLVQTATNGNNNIEGIFLLPDNSRRSNSYFYHNSYASLRTLDKFMNINGSGYKCDLPTSQGTGTRQISSNNMPFTWVQFISPDFNNGNASLPDVQQLVRSAGMNLVLRILDINPNQNPKAPFTAIENSRRIDYATKTGSSYNFIVPGMIVFQYPETQLEEYLVCKKIEENILNRWADKTNYIDQNGNKKTIESLKATLNVKVRDKVENIIADVVADARNGSGKNTGSINGDIVYEVDKMMNDKTIGDFKTYLFRLFDKQNTSSFFTAIRGTALSMRYSLIDAVAKYIEHISDEYQNLTIVEYIIKQIAKSFENIAAQWTKEFGIKGDDNTWNNVWSKQYQNILSSGLIYTLCGCKREHYIETIGQIVDLCLFDTLMPELNEICKTMLNQGGAGSLISNNNIELPNSQAITDRYRTVQELLSDNNNNSVVCRRNQIEAALKNNNPQIIYLYNSGSYDKEIQNATATWNNKGIHFDYSDISSDSVWKFLENGSKRIAEIKSSLVVEGNKKIAGHQLFSSSDIHSILKNNNIINQQTNLPPWLPALFVQIADNNVIDLKIVPPMVKLGNNNSFVQHSCLRTIAASYLSDNNQNNYVFGKNDSQGNPFNSNNSSNYAQVPSLKNTIVFYQIYNLLNPINGISRHFNPLIHLGYQKNVQNEIRNGINNGSYDTELRLPYIDKETLLDRTNVNIQ